MSEKPKKMPRPKARLPRGFTDRTATDIRATEEMIGKIREVYERYGFDPVETPMFEYTDALGKFLPDADRPGEGVFSLQDDDEQWMSLRYDLTAPLARHVAENIHTIQLPYRTWRAGWVFRNEKPGPGRFRQFMQLDADTVGAAGVAADAEMAMMLADAMEAVGIKRGDYVVRVNNRKVLDGVMEAIGVTDESQKLAVLRAIDKLDKFGVDGVRLLLGPGRKDESGDFTKGAGLGTSATDKICEYLEATTVTHYEPGSYSDFLVPDDEEKMTLDGKSWDYSNLNTIEGLSSVVGDTAIGSSAIEELISIFSILPRSGYGSRRIRFDPSVVRGLEYYTGPVFECELTFPVVNEKGEAVVFGSVAGGGRYDGLVKRFTGQDVPATGFSIGVSRLMTALKNLGKLEDSALAAPVLVTVMDRDAEALGRYQKLTQQLREAGIRAEMYQGNPKNFGNQLKYADRRGCPVAVIQGSQEREARKVQLKDLIEGRRQAEAIASNAEWRATRPGQFEIAEADLVAEVRKLLKAQGGGKA
jgi:histidyl-tRNA synthetase